MVIENGNEAGAVRASNQSDSIDTVLTVCAVLPTLNSFKEEFDPQY